MIGSTLLSTGLGLMQANDSKKQAKQTLAAQQANFGKLETAAQPYLNLGSQAAANLSDPNANFEHSPGYNFAIKEGTQNVLGSTALNGLLRSGSAVKALDNYTVGSAQKDFGNWVNQQQGNAGIGNAGLSALSGAVSGQGNALNTYAADRNTASNLGYNAISSGVGGLLSSATKVLNPFGGSSYAR